MYLSNHNKEERSMSLTTKISEKFLRQHAAVLSFQSDWNIQYIAIYQKAQLFPESLDDMAISQYKL